MNRKIHFLAIALLIFWAGYVSSISFMEAWLKFLAPGVTLPIGLSIGRNVFHTLNHVEWFFFVFSLVPVFYLYRLKDGKLLRLIVIIFIILALQSFILLPGLDHRAEMIIQGHIPGKSNMHIYYVVLEGLKVAFLSFLAHYIFNSFPSRLSKDSIGKVEDQIATGK